MVGKIHGYLFHNIACTVRIYHIIFLGTQLALIINKIVSNCLPKIVPTTSTYSDKKIIVNSKRFSTFLGAGHHHQKGESSSTNQESVCAW